MKTFSIDLDLPVGPLLVEASAGTGKTWSIARLVARLIAEDPPEGGAPPTVDRILVVTFTKAAAGELRDRVRAVLALAADALHRVEQSLVAASAPAVPEDPAFARIAGTGVGMAWAAHPLPAIQTRRARLQAAIRDFDRAGISTIHSFCQQVLGSLAFESHAPFDAELKKDVSALVGELVDDWMARVLVPSDDATYAWLTDSAGANLSRGRLANLAKVRVATHHATLIPADAPADAVGQVREQRAADARALLERFTGPEGQEMLDLLAGPTLKGTSYGARTAGHASRLCDWLRAGAWLGPMPTQLFTSSKVVAATKRDCAVVTHPLLDDIEAFGAFRSEDAMLADFLGYVSTEYEARLRAQHALTFDDLLVQVGKGLESPALLEGLRARYRVAMIDEFQDTDGVQWEVFRQVFLDDPGARLILIGDPKQAIYAFRSADIAVYTAARDAIDIDRRYTMDVNHRTDRPLIAALNRMLGSAPNVMLVPEIAYTEVRAKHGPRLFDGAMAQVDPFELRWFDRSSFGVLPAGDPQDDDGAAPDAGEGAAGVTRLPISNSVAEAALRDTLVRDIAADLSRGWRIQTDDGMVPVRPRHIAVLVNTNREAGALQRALQSAGVPAVIAQSGSVFESDEAEWLQRWLQALTPDGGDAAARLVAATPLYAFSARALLDVRVGEDAKASATWTTFTESLAAQARLLLDKGVTAAFSRMLYSPGAPDGSSPLQRLAGRMSGERHLTNLRHLAELLDAQSHADHLGAAGLVRWLHDQRQQAADAEGAELRLESDADTVKIATMHKSKGLEYPIVYLNGLHDGRLVRAPKVGEAPARFHGPGGTLTVDLRGLGEAGTSSARSALDEVIEERQRLLYVALTRAQHRVVVYAGASNGKAGVSGLDAFSYPVSPLGVLVHGEQPGAGAASGERRDAVSRRSLPPRFAKNAYDIDSVRQEAQAFAARHEVVFRDVEPSGGAAVLALSAAAAPTSAPAAFSRTQLDVDWRRESYSGLVKKRKGMLGSVVDEGQDYDDGSSEDDDEAFEAEESEAPADAAHEGPVDTHIPDPDDVVPKDATPIHLAKFPGGAEAGTWVHGVFEHLAFREADAAPDHPVVPYPRDRAQTLSALVRSQGQRAGFAKDTHDGLLLGALPGMIATPLGPRVGGLRLADIPDGDRLDELKFDIAIRKGDEASSHDAPVWGRDLAALLGQARADDPMPPGYLAHVRQMGFRRLVGYLTGAIDLVFRANVDGTTRWFIADYKTNTLGPRLGGRVSRSCPGHYGRSWTSREIARKHYYIQYLIYLTALHRYLTVRQKGYSYDLHVGGAAYLFLRGMEGPGGPVEPDGTPYGVFIDKPPFSIIHGLSSLLGSEQP